MLNTLPFKLPAVTTLRAGQSPVTSDVDTGGYDVLIGGLGFRLATDQQFPYVRATEPTTVHRFDNSAEVGEQTLSPLPWLKSQSSFHMGAGQLNLEGPYVAFQYAQEQTGHMRYDISQGCDVWTPGQVVRLPDTTYSNFGFDMKCAVTAVVGGVDVAVVGGNNSLYQVSWVSGPNSAPTITAMDMSSATFGGLSNISVTSLTTDGRNYYGLLQLTTQGSTAGILTYVITGKMESSVAPTVLYEVPNSQAIPSRTNLCTNPSFETGTTGWAAAGGVPPTLASAATPLALTDGRSNALKMTFGAGGTAGQFNGGSFTWTTVSGQVYTVSGKVYLPSVSGVGGLAIQVAGQSVGPGTTTVGSWVPLSFTFTATGTSSTVTFYANASQSSGQIGWLDEVLIEQTGAVGAYFDGAKSTDSTYSYSWTGIADASTSKATPVATPLQAQGVVGWVKERLMAGLSNSVYELSVNVPTHSALPTAKYTHPISAYDYAAISESPQAVLVAGSTGMQSTIMKFALDTTGATPVLGGGAIIASLPTGEQVYTISAYLGSFVAIGTNKGIRVGTFDTYTGNFTYGPLSVTTKAPVYSITGRDRFIFGSYTNQQPDGKTGLVRVDLTQPIDSNGRLAWAPDLRPPTAAPTGLGTVYAVTILPLSGRLMFATPEGFHVEGPGPGSDGTAYIQTSRIRYDTEEPKLFKAGRVRGDLSSGSITVTGITQYGVSVNLGTFGNTTVDPGEFGLPTGLNPWLQLKFTLNGSGAVFNSYIAKAYPAPSRQRVITMTVNCFRNEVDRFGLSVTDPLFPRDRYKALKALEGAGNEVRFVEFTLLGPVVTMVVIDQIEFHSFSRPSIDDDFGGYITLKLRETVSS